MPIALLRQNKPFRLLYLGHAQIINRLLISRSNLLAGETECRCKRLLVLHLLLSMSLGLKMALLTACRVSRCLGSAFSRQMHRELPVRSLHFDKSLTMQAAHHIFQSIATSTRRTYSSGERHFIRFCPFNNLVSSENHFLPARESTLIHFVTHLANSLSYGTIKFYLVAVNNLHIEFGCPL